MPLPSDHYLEPLQQCLAHRHNNPCLEEVFRRILPSRVEGRVEFEEAQIIIPPPSPPEVVYRRGALTSYPLKLKGWQDVKKNILTPSPTVVQRRVDSNPACIVEGRQHSGDSSSLNPSLHYRREGLNGVGFFLSYPSLYPGGHDATSVLMQIQKQSTYWTAIVLMGPAKIPLLFCAWSHLHLNCCWVGDVQFKRNQNLLQVL